MDEKTVAKLVEAAGKLGYLIPALSNRIARGEADRLRIHAQGKRDAKRIEDGEVSLPEEFATSLPLRGEPLAAVDRPQHIERVRALEDARLLREDRNVARALQHAFEEVSDGSQDAKTGTEDEVDEDWLLRWRDSAGKVSKEHLQQLWGRVLAGEIKQPGAFSLRTIDALRNLTIREAQCVGKLKPFAIEGMFFYEARKSDSPLSIGEGIELQDLQVVTGVATIGLSTNFSSRHGESFLAVLRAATHVLIVTAKNKAKIAILPGWALTPIGRELLSLMPPQDDLDFMRRVGGHIASQGFKVELAQFTEIDGLIKWTNAQIVGDHQDAFPDTQRNN